MPLPPTGHDPVLMAEVLDLLRPPTGGVAVDCTLGRGGHARAIAERLGPGGTLVGLDVDPNNLAAARDRLAGVPCGVRLFHANFAELDAVLDEVGGGPADVVLADLGVSTSQLLDPSYGLTFARSADDAPDAPLDMRLDPRLPRSAADLVNRLPERELADLLFQNAQERFSRRIARKVVAARRERPLRTSAELADLVRSVLPYPKRGDTLDPATRTFMALRMAVNAELPSLDALLAVAPVAPEGRRAAGRHQLPLRRGRPGEAGVPRPRVGGHAVDRDEEARRARRRRGRRQPALAVGEAAGRRAGVSAGRSPHARSPARPILLSIPTVPLAEPAAGGLAATPPRPTGGPRQEVVR